MVKVMKSVSEQEKSIVGKGENKLWEKEKIPYFLLFPQYFKNKLLSWAC